MAKKNITETNSDFVLTPDHVTALECASAAMVNDLKSWAEHTFVAKEMTQTDNEFMADKNNVGHCELCPMSAKIKDASRLPCGRYTCEVGKER